MIVAVILTKISFLAVTVINDSISKNGAASDNFFYSYLVQNINNDNDNDICLLR